MYLDASFVWKGYEMHIYALIAPNFAAIFVFGVGLQSKDLNVLIAVPLYIFTSWLTADGLKR